MKRLFALLITLSLMFCALPAPAEDTPETTADAVQAASAIDAKPSGEVGEAIAMAEAALQRPLDDVPVFVEESPMPEGMRLCGPFLYLAPTASDLDEVFIPAQSISEYSTEGLPPEAAFRVDESLVQATDIQEGTRAVFPLLFCSGYCGSASYSTLGRVSYQAFSALLIDRETGEVVGRLDGPRREGTSMMLSRGDYRKDMNDRYVFWFKSTPKHLKDFWIDAFSNAAVNGCALFLEEGEVTAMLGNAGDVLVIPEGVTGIGNEAFRNREDIKAIRFPDSLTTVGERAFNGCAGLSAVELPEGVTKLSNKAFQDCAALERVTLPEGLTRLDYDCFAECASLKAIDLPSALSKIGARCFTGCVSLTHIAIPKSIKEIPASCFSGCVALQTVEFAGKSTRLDQYAFSNCVLLRQITVPQYAFTIGEGCFSGCTALESVEIVGTLVEVGGGAFDGCAALKALSFRNISNVGAGAFRGCENLAEISFDVTRLHASRRWDKGWREGCAAEIHWKRDPLPPVLAALAVAVVLAAIILVRRRKKHGA